MFEIIDEAPEDGAVIKVIGVGGCGGNAVEHMIARGLLGVDFVCANTDAQALKRSTARTQLQLGSTLTRGLGAGARPEIGRDAAMEDRDRIAGMIEGADMLFITAGMGGGTGTGAAPIIAQLAKEEGALTVGVVTKPFLFEGRQRARKAEHGIALLTEHVDTLITIPNEKLLALEGEDLSFIEAFRKADEVLYQAVKGISDLITQSGIVNVDFADVKTVMSNMGRSMMGTGCAKGQGRARLAAEMAIQSPLLDNISVEGATGVLINIVGGPDLKLKEMEEAASLIQQQAHEDANIIWGASIDESAGEMVKVTVIATGFDKEVVQPDPRVQAAQRPAPSQSFASIPAARAAQSPAPASRGAAREDTLVFSSSRRPQAPAFAHASQPNLPMRERITLPSGIDSEWDTPTFQRKGQ
jgi:cell division protein FtsZ